MSHCDMWHHSCSPSNNRVHKQINSFGERNYTFCDKALKKCIMHKLLALMINIDCSYLWDIV